MSPSPQQTSSSPPLQVLDFELQKQLVPLMRDMVPLPGIYDPSFIAANQVGRAGSPVAMFCVVPASLAGCGRGVRPACLEPRAGWRRVLHAALVPPHLPNSQPATPSAPLFSLPARPSALTT